MNIDKAVMTFAATMILVSLALSLTYTVNWLWLTAFVGLNMFQASITGFCPLVYIFKKMGLHTGQAFN
ncbi:MAG: DUF2892 domain-containing protein [Gammaproteobacteria bacterium]|jgi:hypothetical protein